MIWEWAQLFKHVCSITFFIYSESQRIAKAGYRFNRFRLLPEKLSGLDIQNLITDKKKELGFNDNFVPESQLVRVSFLLVVVEMANVFA